MKSSKFKVFKVGDAIVYTARQPLSLTNKIGIIIPAQLDKKTINYFVRFEYNKRCHLIHPESMCLYESAIDKLNEIL